MDRAGALGQRVYWRMLLTAGIVLLLLGLLAQRLQSVDPRLVLSALAGIGTVPLAMALVATAISFWAVAGYDQAWHRHLRTGVAPARARRAGFAAIAISQTVGMGVVTGAMIRWRMLPELGLMTATRLSLLVALSFLMAWAMVTSLVLWTLPGAPYAALGPWGLACVLAALAAGLVAGLVAGLGTGLNWMPNLFTTARLAVLAAVDCLAAGVALWCLIPGDLGLATFLPAFLLALGAGLVSGSPAGLGAFEIVLLALLPTELQADVLAGVVAWRVIAYGLPALAGAGVALVGPSGREGAVGRATPAPDIAEAGLVAQGDLFVHPGGFVAGRTAHGLVALSAVADIGGHRAAARAEGRWPVLYKLDPRRAARARQAGFQVLTVAREAWLDPMAFRLDLPARAGLRRKLRRADAAGVTATTEDTPDWAELGRVNRAWVTARGREHGFAMGRFEPGYLAIQTVIVARQGAAVVGFASFHVARIGGGQVWTLDLLRPDPAAPEGTAQRMIVAALGAARQAGAQAFSLAAVPIGACKAERGLIARLGRAVTGDASQGLEQFKAGFAPRWQRLYIAAPSILALAIVGAEIRQRVCRPAALARTGRPERREAEYEIAYGCNPWQREAETQA